MVNIPNFAFEAAGQAAGYYFQLRFGLLRALKQIRKDPTGSVSIERLDDVSLWSQQAPHEVDQLKHTLSATEVFSDSSPAVWRTLSNWAQLLLAPSIKATPIAFFLITNAGIARDSALSKLGVDDGERDAMGALDLLDGVALSSKNASTASDRAAFLVLDEVTRKKLVSATTVVPNSPGLVALGGEIDEILYYACESSQLLDFRQELEGWWLQRVAETLGAQRAISISLLELDGKVSALRERYKRSLLTIDVDAEPSSTEDLLDHVFVRQLEAVKVNSLRLRNAQRDFLRASTQRSKWVRDLKLDPAELNRYDAELEEHWSTKSAIMHDDLGEAPDDENKVKAGRTLLGWAETRQVPIRGATAQFLTSGSYHTLADQMRVGWHPDYQTLLRAK